MQRLTEIPYRNNSAELFEHIADEDGAVFLDSGFPYKNQGRYDILSSRPFARIRVHNDRVETVQHGQSSTSDQDPFLLLKNLLGESIPNRTQLPFCGGALGYFSYDLGRRIEQIPAKAINDLTVPDMFVGIYDWAIVVDHHQRRSWWVAAGIDKDTSSIQEELLPLFESESAPQENTFRASSDITCNFTEKTYRQAFAKIQAYIKEGDCYQVNLAQRFNVSVEGNPWHAYRILRELNPAPFAGFMRCGEHAILSSSPERFLQVKENQVETKPIKGTRPRSVFAYEDSALAKDLLESPKDRAENVMIVDLLRNDLGKSCDVGSIQVPSLYSIESYATVHHLVSTVSGRLKNGMTAVDLLRGCFPGGSITGAPKIRAMEIIEELEPHRRSVYCGSLGYIGFDGNMDTNITIRTLVYDDHHLYCWAGGGIIHDSEASAEYRECFDKAAALLKLFRYQ